MFYLVSLVQEGVPYTQIGFRGDVVNEDGKEPIERKHGDINVLALQVVHQMGHFVHHQIFEDSLKLQRFSSKLQNHLYTLYA